MNRVIRLLYVCLFCACLSLCSLVIAADQIPPKVSEFIAAPRYKTAHWGLLAIDLKTGEVRHELNADKLFAPASVTKCYSVASALDALGADFRFETPIVRRGEVNDKGELTGDLILIASGDLTFGGRTTETGEIAFTDGDHTYSNGGSESQLTPQDPLTGLNDLAKQVAAAGIKRVRGDVLIDDRLFEKAEGTGSGPGRLTPIYINDNLIDFMMEVADAASHARTLLIEALQRVGVSVDASLQADHPIGKLPPRDDTVKLPSVAKHVSPPFAENARLILKVSHNLHASTLPLIVAAKNGGRTLKDGLKLQHKFLEKAGVEANTISFGGGAGGDRADYTSPRATVQLLKYMATRPDFEAYRKALPRLGVDGTLAKAVGPESPAKDKANAKTGTLFWDNVMNGNSLLTSKALAGYLTTASGETWAFALFVNNVPLRDGATTASIGKDLGRVCELLFDGP